MFWDKWLNKTKGNTPQTPKLKPPMDLPQQVGRYIVVNLQQDPDWVWSLKAVAKPVEGGKISARLLRVYDPVQAAKLEIKIHNYDSLDACSDLILYEGGFDKGSSDVSLAVHEPAKAA